MGYSGAGAISGNIVTGFSCGPFAYDLSTSTMTALPAGVGGLSSGDIVAFSLTFGSTHCFTYDLSTSTMTDLVTWVARLIAWSRRSAGTSWSGSTVSAIADPHAFAYDVSTSTMTDLGTQGITTASLSDASVNSPYSETLTADLTGQALTAKVLGGAQHTGSHVSGRGIIRNKWSR